MIIFVNDPYLSMSRFMVFDGLISKSSIFCAD